MKLLVRSVNNNETEIIMKILDDLSHTLEEYENEINKKI